VLFDLDGVLVRTDAVHARCWKQLFDEYLRTAENRFGRTFAPFDIEVDYRRYVDGKSREDGVADFLASRGSSCPAGVRTTRRSTRR
jgi:beta-phosphoglucomutase-like phosphatase (HAD superfamily)